MTWLEITPSEVVISEISGVYFFDPMDGWVGIRNGSNTTAIYRTTDGGNTWLSGSVTVKSAPFGGIAPAYFDFLDPKRGWVVADLGSHANFSYGALFGTTDGGATWTELSAPFGHPVRFNDSLNGWTIGGADGPTFNGVNGLYVTHDGGQTWSLDSLVGPGRYGAASPDYGLPSFWGTEDGIVPAVYVDNLSPAFDAYVTADEGTSWAATPLKYLDKETGAGSIIPDEALDQNTWVFVVGGKLYRTEDGGASWIALADSGIQGSVDELSFITTDEGWVRAGFDDCAQFKSDCSSHSALFQTSDGGQTFVQVGIP